MWCITIYSMPAAASADGQDQTVSQRVMRLHNAPPKRYHRNDS